MDLSVIDIPLGSLVKTVLVCVVPIRDFCVIFDNDCKEFFQYFVRDFHVFFRTWDMLGNRQGFLSFNHRGKALYRGTSDE